MILAMLMQLAMILTHETAPAPAMSEILARTGKSVQRFWTQLSSVNCTETVRQEKLGEAGKVQYAHDSIFDYLILMDLQGEEISVEESRILQKEAGKSSDLPLLLTTGFSTLQLVFHPYYQASFEFKPLNDETVNGVRLLKIAFRHIHGMRSTSAVRLRGQNYPLDLSGTAWIDPDTGIVHKMTAGLETPMEDLNLRALRTEVIYAPQKFTTDSLAQWLPVEASIDVETVRQHWRNIHRFTEYRRFSVQTDTKVSK
jgi:hypothetical protein